MSSNYINIDLDRLKRRGYCEAVFCECKTNEMLYDIFKKFSDNSQNVIGTRATIEQYNFLKDKFENIKYNKLSKVLTLIQKPIEKKGLVAICSAGSGDIPCALEAKDTAEFFGSNTKEFFDIGVAGLHRLLNCIDEIRKCNVAIVAAGMDGALASVITGLVDIPVIALPTSVGYGASINGISALLSMINSCAEGMTVVNIDNGFNAGYCANQINRKIAGV